MSVSRRVVKVRQFGKKVRENMRDAQYERDGDRNPRNDNTETREENKCIKKTQKG